MAIIKHLHGDTVMKDIIEFGSVSEETKGFQPVTTPDDGLAPPQPKISKARLVAG